MEVAGVCCKLGVVESQGITRAGQTVLARWMGAPVWCLSAGYVVEGSAENNGLSQCFCLGESCPSSPHLKARPFSSSLYVPGAFQSAALALELRVLSLSRSG